MERPSSAIPALYLCTMLAILMTLHASIIVLKSLPATGMGVLGGPVSGSGFERCGGLDPTRLGDGAVTRRLITDVA